MTFLPLDSRQSYRKDSRLPPRSSSLSFCRNERMGYLSYQSYTKLLYLGCFLPYLLRHQTEINHSCATARHNGSIIIQSIIFGNTRHFLHPTDLCVISHVSSQAPHFSLNFHSRLDVGSTDKGILPRKWKSLFSTRKLVNSIVTEFFQQTYRRYWTSLVVRLNNFSNITQVIRRHSCEMIPTTWTERYWWWWG